MTEAGIQNYICYVEVVPAKTFKATVIAMALEAAKADRFDLIDELKASAERQSATIQENLISQPK